MIISIILILLASCSQPPVNTLPPSNNASPQPVATAFTESPQPQITATTTQTESTPKVIFDADIPEWARDAIHHKTNVNSILTAQSEDITIGFEETPFKVGEIQYFLVTAFDTPLTSISLNEFNYIWSIGNSESPYWSGGILTDPETEKVLIHRWGTHQDGVTVIEDTPETLVSSLQLENKGQLAIIPAQMMNSMLRTIRLDNVSYFQPGESITRSVFSVPIYSSYQLTEEPIEINFSMEYITSINITGVTALARATAVMMRKYGNRYPAELINDILLNADYTHVSNEVTFSPFCPLQDYTVDNLLFCSPPDAFELLTYIDADIIELTGDHLIDYGSEPLIYTLDLYEEAEMATYGGGRNITEAQLPLLLEYNGNKFAFLGCNAKSRSYARATETYPGTWFCDLEILKASIQQLQADGYLPIVSIQHLENDSSQPPLSLVSDFAELAEYPPVILIGSQAHITNPYYLGKDIFIHYGLGNLFFDQINESEAHSHAVIDRVILYKNEFFSVDIFPIQFLDFARSRPMSMQEEVTFLTTLFSMSEFPPP